MYCSSKFNVSVNVSVTTGLVSKGLYFEICHFMTECFTLCSLFMRTPGMSSGLQMQPDSNSFFDRASPCCYIRFKVTSRRSVVIFHGHLKRPCLRCSCQECILQTWALQASSPDRWLWVDVWDPHKPHKTIKIVFKLACFEGLVCI